MPLALSLPIAPAQSSKPARQAAASPEKRRVDRFIADIDIPFETFTLPNGLRVIVHTDHSAPTIYVGVWYDVGSKHEPQGKSGFAHLFEHLMFNGSENVPGDYLKPLMDVGGEVNGSTTADRTNYYEIVPTQALDRALFMESDRMGHLLGAINQETLDEQRGVVQNEKRQGDDKAISIASYMAHTSLYPGSHPYGHSVIGSMKDLNAADVGDVRTWFLAHYGPNNAVLVLAGDVDLETARQKVTQYFAAIPAGPKTVRPAVKVTPMAKTLRDSVTAPITSPVVIREWRVPGADQVDALALDVVMEVLGGGDDSPLTRRLVRESKLFQSVNVTNSTSGQAGEFAITGVVRPGVDPKVAATALDREIGNFLRKPPASDAIGRFISRYVYGFARRLESASARGQILGESVIFHGDPAAFRRDLTFYAQQTPATVMAAARKWLLQPRYELTVLPGPRVTPKDDAGIDGLNPGAENVTASATATTSVPSVSPKTSSARAGAEAVLPPVGPARDSRFPAIEHATLKNGIPVSYARISSVPFTTVSITIDGGQFIEPPHLAGTMGVMYALLSKAFASHDENWVRSTTEKLGISLTSGVTGRSGNVSIDVPDTNLTHGLGLLHELLVSPTFPQHEIERIKREKLDLLARIRLNPSVLLTQVLTPLIDSGAPNNRLVMYDDPAAVRRINRTDILACYHEWVRPERAKVTVTSSKPLRELLPELERTIGSWSAAGTPEPLPAVDYTPRPATPQIVLVDLPTAVQATVEGGQWVPIKDNEPGESIGLANRVLGGAFTSRINMNLREDKHWTYGAFSFFVRRPYGSSYVFNATIQQDKVGYALAEVMKELKDIVGDRPVSEQEFAKSQAAVLGAAASSFGRRSDVLSAMMDVQKYGRPDDYPARTSQRYRDVTANLANKALREQIDPSHWVWGIVGNAKMILPQLKSLGLPVHVVAAKDVLPPLTNGERE